MSNNSQKEKELEEIRKGFEMFDTDSSGKIIPSEVKEAMDAMNAKQKNSFIYEIIESLSNDEEYKNGIEIETLVNYVYNSVNDDQSSIGLRQIFEALSDPNTNTISMKTFYNLAKEFNIDEGGISDKELKYLLEKTQLMGDELTFEEFFTIMKAGQKNNFEDNKDSNNKNNGIYKRKKENHITIDNSRNKDGVYNKVRNIKNPENMNKNNNINVVKSYNPENKKEVAIQDSYTTPTKKDKNIINDNGNIIIKDMNKINLDEKFINTEKIENGGLIEKEINNNEIANGKEQNKINKQAQEIIAESPGLQNSENNNIISEEDFNSKESCYSNREGRNSNKNMEIKENNNVLAKSQNISKNDLNEINMNKKEEGEIFIPKRYHRRYRQNKISTNVDQ